MGSCILTLFFNDHSIPTYYAYVREHFQRRTYIGQYPENEQNRNEFKIIYKKEWRKLKIKPGGTKRPKEKIKAETTTTNDHKEEPEDEYRKEFSFEMYQQTHPIRVIKYPV